MDDNRKQVTICSDSDSFVRALRLLLDGCEVEFISRPSDVDSASDVLVWKTDGEVPLRELEAVASSVPTLLLGDQDQLLRAVDGGCRGFLTNASSLDEISRAVTILMNGGAVIPPHLLGTLLRHLVERRRHDDTNSAMLGELTDRERQVFRLAADGARKEEIGERLYISPATARTHLQRVYRKLGVHSQSELMALAMRIGELETQEPK